MIDRNVFDSCLDKHLLKVTDSTSSTQCPFLLCQAYINESVRSNGGQLAPTFAKVMVGEVVISVVIEYGCRSGSPTPPITVSIWGVNSLVSSRYHHPEREANP